MRRGCAWLLTVAFLVALMPVLAADKAAPILIEFEDYAVQNGMDGGSRAVGMVESFSQASGGAVVGMVSDANTIEEKEFTAVFEAETAGWYNMKLEMSGYEKVPVQVSPITVSVNGEEPIDARYPDFIWSDPPAGIIQPYVLVVYTRNEPVYLEQGKNTITLIARLRDPGDKVVFALDCATFTPASVQQPGIIGETGGTLEFEEYALQNDFGVVEHKMASSQALAGLNSDAVETVDYTVEFTAETEGWYQLQLDVSGQEKAPNQVSPLSLAINGEEMGRIQSPDFIWSDLFPEGDIQPYIIVRYTRGKPVWLQEGDNTLVITAARRITAGGVQDKIVVGLDRAVFTQMQMPVENKFEAEDYGDFSVEGIDRVSSANASGQAFARIGLAGYEAYDFDMGVDLIEDSDYRVIVAVSCEATLANYMSPLYLSIDGGESVMLDSTNFRVQEPKNPYHDNSYIFRYFTYPKTMSLSAGKHQIRFHGVKRAAFGGDGVYFGVDYVQFDQVKSTAGLRAEIRQPLIKGKPGQIQVYNDANEEIDIYYADAIAYQPVDSNMAVTDAYGAVTARNYGVVEVDVTVTIDGRKYPLRATGYCTAEDGVYLTGVRRSGNTVTVDAATAKTYDGDELELLFARYGSQDGVPRSIKEMGAVSVPELKKDTPTPVAYTFAAFESGDMARVFLIVNGEMERVVYQKEEVR